MGTLKAEAVVDKTTGDPDSDVAAVGENLSIDSPGSGAAAAAIGPAGEMRAPADGAAAAGGEARKSSIRRSIVSLLQPSVSPANDDLAAQRKSRAKSAGTGQKLKYGMLLFASALLLIGAVYSLTQSDRFVTDLTVVSFVLILFFLIGLRIESTQGLLRDLSAQVETRTVGLDTEATQSKITTMDAAVARTLGRAGELQSLLRSEDLNFEKAYASREERFRALLEDMAVERAAITTNAEKVRFAIEGAHQNLASDLDSASRRFAELLTETSTALTTRIEDQLQKQSAEAIDICVKRLRSSLDGVLIRAVEQVDARGATLAALISAKSEEFDEKLLNFKKEVALSLNGQIDDTQKAASIRIEAMAGCINRLLDRMNSGISERSESLNQMLATRVLEIASTLKLGKTEMLQTLESAAVISTDMSVKSEAANELLKKQVGRLNESVVVPLGMLVEALKERSSTLTHDLAGQFDAVNEALKTQSSELSTLFDRHVAKLRQTMNNSSEAIEDAIESNRTAAESSLEALFKRHQRPISDEMASVRSEFAAQRKLLAPLVANAGRTNERSNPPPEPIERYEERRLPAARDLEAKAIGRSRRPTERASILADRRRSESVRSDDVRSDRVRSDESARADSARSETVDNTPSRPAAQPRQPVSSREPVREPPPRARDVEPARYSDDKSGQSWLTDILARASDDDHTPMLDEDTIDDELDANIFSAISTNIESLVSSDRTSAAWLAFKRREISQFEEIYTPQGEIVFKKLEALLDADDDLKDSVSKYASQFESLLRERFDDDDEKALLSFLGTSTGKVYTMLAHASNRLG